MEHEELWPLRKITQIVEKLSIRGVAETKKDSKEWVWMNNRPHDFLKYISYSCVSLSLISKNAALRNIGAFAFSDLPELSEM